MADPTAKAREAQGAKDDTVYNWTRLISIVTMLIALAILGGVAVQQSTLARVENLTTGQDNAKDRTECASEIAADAWVALFRTLADADDGTLTGTTKLLNALAGFQYAHINELCPVGG